MTDTLAGFPALETERLRLVPLLPADAEHLRRLTDDPAITDMVDFLASPFTHADALALIIGQSDGRDLFVGVRETTGAALAGVVGLHLRGAADLEFGYWFAAASRGRGFASEAAGAVLEAAGDHCPGRRLVAECREANMPSRHLLDRLGFEMTRENGRRPGRRLFLSRAAVDSPARSDT